MKNHKTSEEMLAITNKYALAEEAILDTRDPKKDKELGHLGQPSTSKSNDKKRMLDHSVVNVERSCHNEDSRPRPGEFQDFMD
jgi:hypothetical protein